jgi:hypothetical protein
MLATHGLPSITFAVDDVPPTKSPLLTCRPASAIQGLLGASSGSKFGPLEACWSVTLPCLAEVGVHPLLAATHQAFADHRPLALSPDIIWLTIVQGLAQHVHRAPETYRRLLVRHLGKRTIRTVRDDLTGDSPENPWDEVIAGLAAGICREAGPLAGQFVADFSTTGPVELAVSEVALMDLFAPYFDYELRCVCGIPTITLEGTPDDWQRVRGKVELLAPFDLDWWLTELRPICDQFARAAGGDVDRAHWQRMYKPRATYGATVMTGWLGKLFPYQRAPRERNPLLEPAMEHAIARWEADHAARKVEAQGWTDAPPGITEDSVPVGLSLVPFTCIDDVTKTERAMQFVAGAMAVTQDPVTLALRPTLGWAVRGEPPTIVERKRLALLLDALASHVVEPATPYRPHGHLAFEIDEGLSDDFRQFFGAYEAAAIHPIRRGWLDRVWPSTRQKSRSAVYTILPRREWTAPAWANADPKWPEYVCFGVLADRTELLIRIGHKAGEGRGEVSVGRRRGVAIDETGMTVAGGFADFLRQALEGPPEVYFRRPGFQPLTPSPARVLRPSSFNLE